MAASFKASRLKKLLAVLLLSFLATTTTNAADLSFDQTDANAGGFLFYTGGNTPLFGSQIKYQRISGNGTPLNNGSQLKCDVCFLNFETGNFISKSGVNFEFGGGGSITMDGTIEFPTENVTDNILTGSFGTSPKKPNVNVMVGGQFQGFGADKKSKKLSDFFGLGPNWTFSNNEIFFNVVRQCGEGEVPNLTNPCFTFGTQFKLSDLENDGRYAGSDDVTLTIGSDGFLLGVRNGDLFNFPAPEPGTSLLMLMGLSSLVAFKRR